MSKDLDTLVADEVRIFDEKNQDAFLSREGETDKVPPGGEVEDPPRSASPPVPPTGNQIDHPPGKAQAKSDLWIQTRGRRRFSLTNPRVEDVIVEDVAFSIAHINRFSGHVGIYSVEEHSVRAASIVWHLTKKCLPTLRTLCHDGGEAFTGDITSPIKRFTGARFHHIEDVVDFALVGSRASKGELALVKHADLVMLSTEVRDLLGGFVEPWGDLSNIAPLPETIRRWSASRSYTVLGSPGWAFLAAYRALKSAVDAYGPDAEAPPPNFVIDPNVLG